MSFYYFQIDGGRHKKFAYGIDLFDYYYKKISCLNCGLERNEIVNEPSINKIVLSNSHFPDFLLFNSYKLVSSHVQEIFIEEKITGYELKPIEILSANHILPEKKKQLRLEGDNVSKLAVDPPRYSILSLTGYGELHPDSQITINICKDCGSVRVSSPGRTYVDPEYPLIINKNSWDGSDLFTVPYLKGKFLCSQRFVDVYRNHNLTGLNFEMISLK